MQVRLITDIIDHNDSYLAEFLLGNIDQLN